MWDANVLALVNWPDLWKFIYFFFFGGFGFVLAEWNQSNYFANQIYNQ